MSEEAPKIPKPQMRGLLAAQIKRNLILAGVGCVVGGILMKFLYVEPRKRVYAEFYQNYDINKEFNRIRRKGLFDSCAAIDESDDEEEEEKENK